MQNEKEAEYEIIEVRCLGCGELVSPAEVDWNLFRNWGMPIHAKKECEDKLAKKLEKSAEVDDHKLN